jgi:hypothetical protein
MHLRLSTAVRSHILGPPALWLGSSATFSVPRRLALPLALLLLLPRLLFGILVPGTEGIR